MSSPAPGGDEWGALLEKDSALTDCVSAAVDELRELRRAGEDPAAWINAGGGVATLE